MLSYQRLSHGIKKGAKGPFFYLGLPGLIGASALFAAQGFSPAMSDFNLTFEAADIAVQNSACIILSNGGDSQTRNYRLTVSEVGKPAAGFVATNASYPAFSLPLYLTWRDDNFPSTPLWSVVDGVEEAVDRTGNTTAQCGGSPNLSYLVVEYRRSDYLLSYAPAGLYSTTLDIQVRQSAQGSTVINDTVVINLDIEELVSISGLNDVVLNYPPGWQAGDFIEVEESFCIYTNDVLGDVYVTPSSLTLHNGNATTFGVENVGLGLTRRYNVAMREVGGAYAGNIDNGVTAGPFNTQGSNIDCSNNGNNTEVRIRVPAGQAQTAREGSYSGVLELLVTIQ